MDTRTAAQLQGPVARSASLVAVASGFVGAIVIAGVRIARDGALDVGSLLWILAGCVWAGSFLLLELTSNRRLGRVAAASRTSSDELIVLFRAGDLTAPESAGSPQAVDKGWFTLGQGGLSVTDLRGPSVIAAHPRREVLSANAEGDSGSYGVLRVSFTDGTLLTVIPVKTGFRSGGMGADDVSSIASAVSNWSVGG